MNPQADAYLDLAEVLAEGGKDPREFLEEALDRYERKGNVVMTARTCERLASLGELDE